MTRREICEQIQHRLAGGTPSADFEPVLDEINSWLNHGLAAAAMKSYTDAVQIEGVESVPDGTYTMFKNLPIAADTEIGLYTVTLPTAAYGLPRGYDITAAWIQTNGKLGATMIRVDEKHIAMYMQMKRPPNSILFWMDNAKLWIDTEMSSITDKKIAIRMAGSAGNLNDEVNLPADGVPYVIEYVWRYFAPSTNQPKDTVNDGQNIK